ncbi:MULTISPECIES: hypothetical protein [Corynebacterium]|uniref:Uncharacterized protein n=2 Tax=Corynebacterium TaxID=1716 RepID=A0ABN4EM05_9CORY|nr:MULTISPECIES: hypothetical protein [Corynebacterium]AIT90135.1 Hypothetical protein Cul210932_2226 [Corynebacterium ulcerans]AIU33662.1 Hypothetical protein CulFRC11_2114 [Corynebacterium ramonii FRC0011]AIU92760.1 Hypothetical protein Cul05146_2222 [Corynebacterium ulcerans]AKA97636.1 Hypothetical protein CUL131002_2136c [Corynebacterium ulcerans]AKN78104.1 Hypothetical protein CulFRC58_2250 [Corynebacterium ulcerans FRC58]
MDINAILLPVMDFFSQGIGRVIANILQAIYSFFYPANAPAATLPEAK